MVDQQNDSDALAAFAGGVKTLIKGNGLATNPGAKFSALDMKKKDDEIAKLKADKKDLIKKNSELKNSVKDLEEDKKKNT